MKFVDQAVIQVQAGKGGDGCLSFRRARHVPRGGPDGGDGGSGGSAILIARSELHTLIDFRYRSEYKAESGRSGGSKNRTGAKGKDLIIPVPVGTRVFSKTSDLLLGDLVRAGDQLLVAEGGSRGIGNVRFKSSVNRAPRKIIKGGEGEFAALNLELLLLADVGLIGQPNAGKSTLISSVSAARPKIADYPFTTRRPYLGVVRLGPEESFVMADIPGLIKGAGTGAGLGIQFLKHAERAGLLLQLVSLRPEDNSSPEEAFRIVEEEMAIFSKKLAAKPRWLVLTKSDALPPEVVRERTDVTLKALNWRNPFYVISAPTGAGLQPLLNDLRLYMNRNRIDRA